MNALLKTLATTAICLGFFTNTSFAKTLECNSNDFTYSTVTINRDGAIGFDGTFLTIFSGNGFLGFEHSNSRSLQKVTSRTEDKDFQLQGFILPLGPKGGCTPSTGNLLEDFTCDVKGVSIQARGVGRKHYGKENSVIAEEIQKTVRVIADVTVTAKFNGTSPDGTVRLSLSGKIVEQKLGGISGFNKGLDCRIVE